MLARAGQWTGAPMGSSDQARPKSIEAHLKFKWTGLLTGLTIRAKIGPVTGQIMGNVQGPGSRSPSPASSRSHSPSANLQQVRVLLRSLCLARAPLSLFYVSLPSPPAALVLRCCSLVID